LVHSLLWGLQVLEMLHHAFSQDFASLTSAATGGLNPLPF